MIAAYVVIHASKAIALRLGFGILLPIIGIYVARKINMSVAEADRVINFWHRQERIWYEDVCKLQDATLRAYLLAFWGERWPAASLHQTTATDEIHENSFQFQRNIHKKLILAWSFILLIGLIVDAYVAFRVGTLDGIFGVP